MTNQALNEARDPDGQGFGGVLEKLNAEVDELGRALIRLANIQRSASSLDAARMTPMLVSALRTHRELKHQVEIARCAIATADQLAHAVHGDLEALQRQIQNLPPKD